MIRGYDFIVNAVWPEIVSNIEARTPSMFAPGNPNLFHQVHMISYAAKAISPPQLLCGMVANSFCNLRLTRGMMKVRHT